MANQTFLCPVIGVNPPVVERCPQCGWEFHAPKDWLPALLRQHKCPDPPADARRTEEEL